MDAESSMTIEDIVHFNKINEKECSIHFIDDLYDDRIHSDVWFLIRMNTVNPNTNVSYDFIVLNNHFDAYKICTFTEIYTYEPCRVGDWFIKEFKKAYELWSNSEV